MATAVEPIGRMTPYGPEHIGVIIFTVLVAIGLVIPGRRTRGTACEDRFLSIGG